MLQFVTPKTILLPEFLLARGMAVLCHIQVFSGLDEACLHYEERSSLLKIHEYK